MRRLFLIMFIVLISGVAAGEEPAQPIASDPRIVDALAAWTVWVR